MKVNLCALTEDVLPLFAEDLLSPATRQLLVDHAAECPDCRERLQAAAVPPAPPPPPPLETPLDKPARRFFGRLRRILYQGLAIVVVLLILAGSLGYAAGRKSPWEKQQIPARTKDPSAIVAEAVPGWKRAEAAGLIMDLGITERFPGLQSQATITLEKTWYTGRQVYISYTVKAPEGGYVLPTRVLLGQEGSKTGLEEGTTDWTHLSRWGGFSPEGFHSVIIFPEIAVPADVRRMQLTFRQWARVTPEDGLIQGEGGGGDWSVLIPWQPSLREPAPEIIPWARQHIWMGRTLALDQLAVGIGRIELTGAITLPEGERKPVLGAQLVIGEQTLAMRQFKADPLETAGRYRFTASFDGPDQWPAPVKLDLFAITFETDKTLQWPVNWAKYRDLDGGRESRRLMDAADQVTVRFYDSDLTSIFAVRSGVSIEQKESKQEPPYVRASIGGGGRMDPAGPGGEVVNAAGEVLTNIGGGGGVIYEDSHGKDQRQGFAFLWWDALPENYRQSDRLTLRYVYPSATLVLKETWELPRVQ